MFEVIEAVPAVDEFCDLRIAAGLSAMDRTAAAAALPRSLHAVQVTDIAVHPEFQGQGLSRLVMASIMGFVATLPRSTIVSLFADVDWLYGKFGFAVPRASVGMMLRDWPTS